MPKRCKHCDEATDGTGDGEDRISALPDAILQVVLSCLPSDEMVWTCVLSRRWPHLWKSTPALRIVHCGDRYWNAVKLNNFVNYLLLLRDRLALDECEISYSHPCGFEELTEIFRFSGMWIHYAVSLCQAQVLKVCIRNLDIQLMRGNSALVSQFLRRVELTGVILWDNAIDFSGCPKLEHLNLCSSRIYGHKISSQSLRRLSITDCVFNLDSGSRIHNSAPCIVSLQLDDVIGVPLLESMPSLVTAFIRLGGNCLDKCVLLQGLSGATSLELTTMDRDVFIFKKDLKQCPTFSMLKTLLLNEWCVAADCGALVYFLQHTPVLEKLILQLQPYEVLILKQLKVVEIRCDKEDEVVRQIVKILSTFGVSSDQIDLQVIQHSPYSKFSQRFSFEQT